MLDSDGICRWVAAAPARGGAYPATAKVPDHAERCIGAQYVASMDLAVKGGLIDLPSPGAPLLFARIEPNGRIALVRTGPLVRFETRSSSNSGVRALPPDDDARKPKLEPYRFDTIPEINDEEMTTPYRASQPPSPAPAAGRPASIPPWGIAGIAGIAGTAGVASPVSDVAPKRTRGSSAPPPAVEPRSAAGKRPARASDPPQSPRGTIRPPAPSEIPTVRKSIRPPASSLADTVRRPRPSVVRIVPPVWDDPGPTQRRRAR
jgi:hypothetical protein